MRIKKVNESEMSESKQKEFIHKLYDFLEGQKFYDHIQHLIDLGEIDEEVFDEFLEEYTPEDVEAFDDVELDLTPKHVIKSKPNWNYTSSCGTSQSSYSSSCGSNPTPKPSYNNTCGAGFSGGSYSRGC